MFCSVGFFFTVKELSFLDHEVQGSRLEEVSDQVRKMTFSFALVVLLLKESLLCPVLEIPLSDHFFFLQAISLLSTFEHENIVQYIGTSKVYFLFNPAFLICFFSFFLQQHLHFDVLC